MAAASRVDCVNDGNCGRRKKEGGRRKEEGKKDQVSIGLRGAVGTRTQCLLRFSRLLGKTFRSPVEPVDGVISTGLVYGALD
jgi:hypothetical protein